MRSGAWGRWALWSGFVVLLLVAAAAWLVTSEFAFRWLVQQATQRSGGSLVVEQPSRIGLAGFRADRITYTEGGLRIAASDVNVIVSAASLLHLRPVVREIGIDELRLRLAEGDDQPLRLPDRIALPFRAAIDSARVQRFVLERPAGDLEFHTIALSASYREDGYHLTVSRLQTPWAAVAGRLRLQDAAPFEIDGLIGIRPALDALGSFDVALAGALQTLGVGAVGTAYGSKVKVQAAVLPFASGRMAAISIAIQGLNTEALGASLPRAHLGIGIEAAIDAGPTAAGRVHVLNSQPGLPADGRLPIAAASAAFQGGAQRWSFDDIAIDGARAGRLSGRATFADKEVVADLTADRLDLKAIHARLHPTALTGPLHVQSDGSRIELKASFEQPGARIVFDGAYDAGEVTVHAAQWATAAGEIQLQGAVQANAPHRFRASGNIVGLDPAQLGDFPPARLNAGFDAKGQIAPLNIEAELAVTDSRFRDQALAGTGRLRLTPDRLSELTAQMRLGSASAHVQGSLGAPRDSLAWQLDAPDLRVFEARAAGRVQASGVVRGHWRDPALAFQVDATGLRWGEGTRAGRLQAKGELAEGIAGRFEVAASADKILLGELGLDRAQLDIAGTRERHDANIQASGKEYRLEGRVSGGLTAGPGWTGTIAALNVEGPIPARLEQPVEITASAAAVSVGPATVHIGSGRIELTSAAWQASGQLASRGAMHAIALSSLRPLLPVPEALRALVVAGQWDVDIGESLNGSVSLQREGGDIVIPGPPPLTAQLQSFRIEARGQGSEIALHAELDSAAFGRMRAEGTTRAVRRGALWGVAADAPLDLRVDAQMPSLAWIRPLLAERATLEGRADVALQVQGTIARPLLSGELRGAALQAAVPELGLTLRDGDLLGRFDGQKLEIVSLRFAGGDGEVTGTGSATLVPGKVAARIELKANKLTAMSRPDRLIVLSGQVGVEWDEKQMRARGQLVADRVVIELPREDTPTPSRDVIVLTAKPAPEQNIHLDADLTIDLGKDFNVRGRGISTRLAGSVRAQVIKGSPTLTGSVRAVEGTYTAFGQTLSIERGTLTFVGPVNNPALDILAVRKNLSVEVGVAIGGTALLPQVRLVSTPSMSDADKLAWLTLGHGLDQAGRNEAAVLQAAVTALMSRDGSQGGLAGKFGLDELALGTASETGERIVTVGKRLGSNVLLGFEHGITGAVNVIKITYDLSRRWSVQARAGSENAVDLFYTLGFR